MKKRRSLFLLLLSAALSLSTLDAVPPIQSVITAVNKDGITVQSNSPPGLKVTIDGVVQPPSNVKVYSLGMLTKITIDGLPGTLDQLKPGMAADVIAGVDRKVASSITANTIGRPLPVSKTGSNAIIGMRVQSVTSDRITIAHPGSKASAYLITKDTKIKVNGTASTADAIEEGMCVIVSSDGQKATGISAQNPPPLR